MCSINFLPREVLTSIFKYYLETETQRAFLHSVAKVSRRWEDVALDPSLWNKFDGSLSLAEFHHLCKHGCLQNVTDFAFCKMHASKKEDLREIYSNLPKLESVDLTKIKWLDVAYFTELIDHCSSLNKVVFNRVSSYKKQMNFLVLATFLEVWGSNLVSINVSNLSISKMLTIFKLIANFCPNLEELHAQNVESSDEVLIFPIKTMQKGCRKLKVLCLGYPILYMQENEESSLGFRDLEIFSHGSKCDSQFVDLMLQKLLFQSPKLRVLDVRGCSSITADCLCSLSCDLERIFFCASVAPSYVKLQQLLCKWQHSLKELDLSKTVCEDLTSILRRIASNDGFQNLERIHLNNTNVSSDVILMMLEKCSKLEFLQLENCAGVTPTFRQVYRGRADVQHFYERLSDDELYFKPRRLNSVWCELANSLRDIYLD